MKTPRGVSWLVRAWLGATVMIVASGFLPLGRAAETNQPVKEVGRLPISWPPGVEHRAYPGQGTMLLNAKARRAYQIFRTSNSRTMLTAIDLDTFKVTATETYDFIPVVPCTACQYIGEYIHVIDEAQNKIYLAYLSSGTWAGIAEIDGITLKLERRMTRAAAFQPQVDPNNPCTSTTCIPMPVGAAPALRGLSFVPAITSPASADKLLLLLYDDTSSASAVQNVIWVSQWDIRTARQDWIYRVTACGSQPPPNTAESRSGLGLFQSPNGPFIYVGCIAAGGTGQVVRLDQDSTSRPLTETGFLGPRRLTDVIIDPEADRMLLRVSNDEGESFWVFDGPSLSYTGVIGTAIGSAASAVGLDETTGRLYVLTQKSVNGPRTDPGGLLMADARRSPAPQAIAFPQFSAGSDYRIRIDPAEGGRPTRIFMIPKLDFELPRGQQAYRVIQDGIEVSVDPDPADQDRFTTDVEEAPGVTESNFTGSAHAYGFRTVIVGGLEGANPVRSTMVQALSPCLKPDREVVVGRVRRAALSNNLASASSIAADAEAVTRTDLQEPGNRCYPRGLAPALQGVDALIQERLGPVIREADKTVGQEWPFQEAECAGDQIIDRTAPSLPGFTSSSRCAQTKQEIEASGVGHGFENDAGLRTGEAYTSVNLRRVAGRGLVVRSEAWVRGIEVPQAFSIDTASTSAEAFAAGRYGTAGSVFKRAICGVRIPIQALSSLSTEAIAELPKRDGDVYFEGCWDPFTQIKNIGPQGIGTQTQVNNAVSDRPLVFLLNRALGSRGRIRVPDPDAELAKGTPGGYLASVQKNRGEEIQARAISNDASTEVPAFELVMFNDDQFAGRGRQLYQFAGVDASSTYGIFVPNTDEFFDLDSDAEEVSLPDLLIDMTGGFPELDTPTGAVVAGRGTGPQNAVAALVNRVAQGIKFLARSPREAVLAALVWLLLGLPLYLSARRRLLLAQKVG